MSTISHASQSSHGSHGAGHGDSHGGGHGPELGFLKKFVFSVDHKTIGIQFLFLGLIFMVVGGLLAMLIRWQLAWPFDKTHPVPVLSTLLWESVDAEAKLGSISSLNAETGDVVVRGIAAGSIKVNDSVNIGPDAQKDFLSGAKVTAVDGDTATIHFDIPDDAEQMPKADMSAWGKRVPGGMPPDFYGMVFTMHASIMIFFVIIPLLVGTFGNYLIPIKIGAGDMAFPFLNGMAFWSAVPAGAIMIAAFFLPGGGAVAGWTSYPPLSARWNPGNEKKLDYMIVEGPLDHVGNFLRAHGTEAAFRSGTTSVKYLAPLNKAVSATERNLRELGYTNIETKWIEQDASAEVSATGESSRTAKLIFVQSRDPNKKLTYDGTASVNVLRAGRPDVDASTLLISTLHENGWQGTWPTSPLITNFLALLLMFGFICAYYIRLGNKTANALVGTVLSLTAAYFALLGVQRAAFDGQSCWFLALIWLGFSSLMGAVNYLTTIIKLRCPGMTMFRLPLSVWSLFITSILVLLATPVLASALTLNLLDHHHLTSFFEPFNWTLSNVPQENSGGGYPLLHQHLFWFYSHPAVYIMILPAMGMVSDILAVGARKPIFGYRPMVYAMAGIAFLGFIVWAHHMFQSGMNPTLGTTFAVSTMFIAVPSAIKTFNWLGTLWGGNIRFTTAMCNAIAFVAMFVIGGLSGIFMASTPVDVFIHDTYFIVAHIHYVLFGGSMFGIWAAIYFWYPKMFGRMMNEKLGIIHFVLSFIFFNCTFFPMHILGIGGLPRRYAAFDAYKTFAHFHPMNMFISMSAFGLGLSQIPFIINFIGSWIWGPKAPRNPWEATTLEWTDADSPPIHGNFDHVPVVHHGPYEYSSPLVEEDWLAQTRYVEGAEEFAAAQKH